MAGKEQRKQAVRRWKFEKPQLGQVQSPGRGRFFDGGKGVRSGGPPGGWEPAARSRTRDEDGETSMARSLRARPFMLRDSAACVLALLVMLPLVWSIAVVESDEVRGSEVRQWQAE
jgi:hypothetical protein